MTSPFLHFSFPCSSSSICLSLACQHSHILPLSLSLCLHVSPSWAFSSVCKGLHRHRKHARGEVDETQWDWWKKKKKKQYHLLLCLFLLSSASFHGFEASFCIILMVNRTTLLIQQRINSQTAVLCSIQSLKAHCLVSVFHTTSLLKYSSYIQLGQEREANSNTPVGLGLPSNFKKALRSYQLTETRSWKCKLVLPVARLTWIKSENK